MSKQRDHGGVSRRVLSREIEWRAPAMVRGVDGSARFHDERPHRRRLVVRIGIASIVTRHCRRRAELLTTRSGRHV